MPHELAVANFNLVVAAVRRHGTRMGLTREDIGRLTHLSYQTIDKVVDRAIAKGLLEREPLARERICPVMADR